MDSIDDLDSGDTADESATVGHAGLMSVVGDINLPPLTNDNPHRTSPVFQYFGLAATVTERGVHPWLCKLCIAAGVDLDAQTKWSAPNTTNLWRHLKNHHKAEYALSWPARGQTQAESDTPSEGDFKQSDTARTTAILARWLVADAHPYAIVEQKLFREYSASFRSSHRVPCRQTVSSKIQRAWEQHKRAAREKVVKDISDGRRWCATTDMWTSTARKAYMVITLHYIDNEWKLRSVILAFVRVVYPHTGVRLAEAFTQAVVEMDPELMTSLWAITADNASNNSVMVNTMNDDQQARLEEALTALVAQQPASASPASESATGGPRIVYLRCLAHVLQLAVKEGVKKCPDMNQALGGLRDVVKKFQDSPKLYEKYQVVCKSLQNTKATMFKLDVETRWNSTYDMIDHLLKSRTAIEDLAHRIYLQVDDYRELHRDMATSLTVAPEAWDAAALYHSFLKPFKDATVLLSGSKYPTLGIVPLLYQSITLHVNTKVAEAEAELVRASVAASLFTVGSESTRPADTTGQANVGHATLSGQPVQPPSETARARPLSVREAAAERERFASSWEHKRSSRSIKISLSHRRQFWWLHWILVPRTSSTRLHASCSLTNIALSTRPDSTREVPATMTHISFRPPVSTQRL